MPHRRISKCAAYVPYKWVIYTVLHTIVPTIFVELKTPKSFYFPVFLAIFKKRWLYSIVPPNRYGGEVQYM